MFNQSISPLMWVVASIIVDGSVEMQVVVSIPVAASVEVEVVAVVFVGSVETASVVGSGDMVEGGFMVIASLEAVVVVAAFAAIIVVVLVTAG